MREEVTRNYGKNRRNGNVKMQVIPKSRTEDPPVGAQIVQRRSNRSLPERVLSRVAHVEEPVLIPVDQKISSGS